MNPVNTNEKRKRRSGLHAAWGIGIGILGIAFGLGVWALQTLKPSPAEDPNWVPLAEVQTLRDQLAKAERQNQMFQQTVESTQTKLRQIQQSHTQLADTLKQSLPLDQIPAELRGPNPALTAANIQRLWQDQQVTGRTTVKALLTVLGQIVETGIINTTRPADDDATRNLYRAVQTVLQSIGTYQGQIDGDQAQTYQALTDFQKSHQLKVDGKMGMQTFGTMAEQLQTTLTESQS